MPHPLIDRARLRRSLGVAIWTILAISDAVLVARRSSGEFVSPIPGALALLSAAVVAVASWIAWSCYRAGASPEAGYRRLIPHALSVGVTAFWVWPISTGAAAFTVGLLFAVVFLHAAAIAAYELESDLFMVASWPTTGTIPAAGPSVVKPIVPSAACELPQASFPAEPLDEKIDPEDAELSEEFSDEVDTSQTLWLSRRQTEDGEQIEGWTRVDFAPGQRETIVHVAFCPPLGGTPELETEDLDGVGLEIRVAAVFPFGARLSVRRSGALAEPRSDRIGFIALAQSSQRTA